MTDAQKVLTIFFTVIILTIVLPLEWQFGSRIKKIKKFIHDSFRQVQKYPDGSFRVSCRKFIIKLTKCKCGMHYFNANKEYHRLDGPAIEYADGSKQWYINGENHREDGPAFEDVSSGCKKWYKNGKLHREGGPAEQWINGDQTWYIDGKEHRLDGPAVICTDYFLDGEDVLYIWYYNGTRTDCQSQEEFEFWLRKEKLKAFW